MIINDEVRKVLQFAKEDLEVFVDSYEYDEDEQTEYLKYKTAKCVLYELDEDERNIMLLRIYGDYKTIAEMAEDLSFTRQYLAKAIREIKMKIKTACQNS